MTLRNTTMNRDETPLVHRTASRRQVMAGAVALGIAGISAPKIWAADDGGISHADAIHQEPVFKATRKQVYEALTDAKKFDEVTRLGDAMRSMTASVKPTEISSEVGGAFTLFGGYITGRHLELVPNERIVQA